MSSTLKPLLCDLKLVLTVNGDEQSLVNSITVAKGESESGFNEPSEVVKRESVVAEVRDEMMVNSYGCNGESERENRK